MNKLHCLGWVVNKEKREERKGEGKEAGREKGRAVRLRNEIICLW